MLHIALHVCYMYMCMYTVDNVNMESKAQGIL